MDEKWTYELPLTDYSQNERFSALRGLFEREYSDCVKCVWLLQPDEDEIIKILFETTLLSTTERYLCLMCDIDEVFDYERLPEDYYEVINYREFAGTGVFGDEDLEKATIIYRNDKLI